MPIIRFVGRVMPYAVNLSVANLPTISSQEPTRDLQMTFKINIQNSFIHIECQINKFLADDFVHVHKRAVDLVRTTTNLASFAMAISMTPVLDTFITDDGVPSAILLRDLRLAPLVTAFSPARQEDFANVASIALADPRLMFALDDLIGAISLHHISPINCARVVESLRNMIAPPGLKRPKSWDIFRSNLNLEEGYVRLITQTSSPPRHGDRAWVSGEIMLEITKRTWVIMDRYLEYRKRGERPLPLTEYPMLSETG